jgi:hypothetical protein
MLNEEVDVKPEIHHVIGKTQNYPENITLFLQKNAGDPAIKVLSFLISNSTSINLRRFRTLSRSSKIISSLVSRR